MKKWLIGLTVLLCALVIAVPMALPALAGDIAHFKGEGVSADWFLYDEVSGNCTYVNVWASGELNQQPPGKPQAMRSVMVDVWMSGPSMDVEIFCWGDIPADCLVINKNLDSAILMVTDLQGYMIDYYDYTETEVNLDVNIEWTANGPLMRNSENYRYQSPYGNYNYHYTGKSRDAIAEGTISWDGDSIELGTSEYASIFSGRGGYVEVSK